jgi:hypothetical protein
MRSFLLLAVLALPDARTALWRQGMLARAHRPDAMRDRGDGRLARLGLGRHWAGRVGHLGVGHEVPLTHETPRGRNGREGLVIKATFQRRIQERHELDVIFIGRH